MTNFIINDKFDIVDYSILVEQIAEGYFDDGKYVPHLGRINTIMLFHSHCVDDGKIVDKEDFEIQTEDMDIILSNAEFIEEYNKCLQSGTCELCFSNAYMDAMEIVNTRKGSAWNSVEFIMDAVESLSEKVLPALSEENLDRLSNIVGSISNKDAFMRLLAGEELRSKKTNLTPIHNYQKAGIKKNTQKNGSNVAPLKRK